MEFRSPAISNNLWKLCFKNKKEMLDIFYENRTPEEGAAVLGITGYEKMTVYLDKDLDGFLLKKVLRHELMHIYLWETGQQNRENYTEEEVCDLMSVAGPAITDTVDKILLRLKEGGYKNG